MPVPPQLQAHAFKKGDPKASEAGKKHSTSNRIKLMKRLETFDEAAWSTLARLFESEKPELALEGLKIWAKYRLHCLTNTQNQAEQERNLPKMSPDFARRILEVLDS